MLSTQVQERIAPPANLFYCDCHFDCLDNFTLPTEIIDMLYADNTLMLLVGKHTSDLAGDVVERGKGWKVCRVQPQPIKEVQ